MRAVWPQAVAGRGSNDGLDLGTVGSSRTRVIAVVNVGQFRLRSDLLP